MHIFSGAIKDTIGKKQPLPGEHYMEFMKSAVKLAKQRYRDSTESKTENPIKKRKCLRILNERNE